MLKLILNGLTEYQIVDVYIQQNSDITLRF